MLALNADCFAHFPQKMLQEIHQRQRKNLRTPVPTKLNQDQTKTTKQKLLDYRIDMGVISVMCHFTHSLNTISSEGRQPNNEIEREVRLQIYTYTFTNTHTPIYMYMYIYMYICICIPFELRREMEY